MLDESGFFGGDVEVGVFDWELGFCRRGAEEGKKWQQSFHMHMLEADGVASVDGEDGPCDIAGVVGCEEEGGLSDVCGRSEVAHRGAGHYFLFSFGVTIEGFFGHLGSDEAGGDAIDADTEGGEFGGHGAGDAFNGRFGCGVGNDFWDAVLGGHAADVEDGSFFIRDHGFDDFTGESEDGVEVSMEDACEVFVGGIDEFFFLVDAGVVDEDIDLTELVDDGRYQGRDGGDIVEIGAEGMAVWAECGLGGGEFFGVAADDHGCYIVLCEFFRYCETYSAGSSCDDCDFFDHSFLFGLYAWGIGKCQCFIPGQVMIGEGRSIWKGSPGKCLEVEEAGVAPPGGFFCLDL